MDERRERIYLFPLGFCGELSFDGDDDQNAFASRLGAALCEGGLAPVGAVTRRFFYEPGRNMLALAMAHQSWPNVPPGVAIPAVTVLDTHVDLVVAHLITAKASPQSWRDRPPLL